MKLPAVPAELRQWPPQWPPAPFPLNKIEQDVPPHDERTARLVGRLLGWAFSICFVTGMISHIQQHPADWFALPSRPVRFYQVSQGLHVATGTAAIPLLLAKLWVVYPKLFVWPPVKSVSHALERLSVAVLIFAGIFQLVTGVFNTTDYYPWGFGFTQTHYAVAWLAFGALLTHIAFMLPKGHRRRHVGGPDDGKTVVEPAHVVQGRRGVMVAGLAGSAALTLATVGQTFSPLRSLAVLAPRRPSYGQTVGIPVNRTANAAQIPQDLTGYVLTLRHDGKETVLTMADLRAMPQFTVTLPIACVEGWSADGVWTGVRVRDLLTMAGAKQGTAAFVLSLEKAGAYGYSQLNHWQAWDSKTLLALQLRGADLTRDHGAPVRLISPNRPGVLQTKWVNHLETM